MEEPLDQQEIEERYQEQEQEQYHKLKQDQATVLVVGRTGTGKSSLINAIFGKRIAKVGVGKPVTQHYEYFSNDDSLVAIFDSKGWEGGVNEEDTFFNETQDLLTSPEGQEVDVIWYVLDAPGARFTEFDVKLAQEAFGGLHVLFVLTKCDIARQGQIDGLREAIEAADIPNSIGVVEIAAHPAAIRGVAPTEPFGLEAIIERTLDILPESRQAAFTAAQVVNLERKRALSRQIILTAAATAFGTGFTPIPMADAPLIASTQTGMLAMIASIYNLPINLTTTVSGFLTKGIITTLGRSAAGRLLKFVPLAGTFTGGVITGSVAASITAAMGFAFREMLTRIAELQAEGKADIVTPDWMAEFLDQAFTMILDDLKKRQNVEGYDTA